LFKLAKTVIEGSVLLLAAYAFAFVPLGEHTALEHLKAILGTKEAQHAGRELKQAGGRVVDELLKSGSSAGSPRLPPLKPAQSKLAPFDENDAGPWNIEIAPPTATAP
jgi:hypothetical protein